MPTGTLTRKTSRQSDTRHQQAAERRADAGGERGDRAEQRHRVRAALGRERLEHERQRRGDDQRGADRLQDPVGGQRVGARGDRAQRGGDREQRQADHEDPAAAEQVGQLAARHQERREDDVVGVQDPRQARDALAAERERDVGERDVDDRRVDERHEDAERRDQQDGARLGLTAAHRLARRGRWGSRRGMREAAVELGLGRVVHGRGCWHASYTLAVEVSGRRHPVSIDAPPFGDVAQTLQGRVPA